tara:strand:- start:180 stop:362 length:183 start_codon:yes stop_codon:yes gene_type:complete
MTEESNRNYGKSPENDGLENDLDSGDLGDDYFPRKDDENMGDYLDRIVRERHEEIRRAKS